MKKIISTLVVLALFAGSIFALDLDVAFGGAYGFAARKTVNEDTDVTTKIKDNAFGVKAGVKLGLTNDLGIKINAGLVFPKDGTKVITTDKNGNSSEATLDYDKTSVFNCFLGPVYTVKSTDTLKIDVGLGVDLGYNKYVNTTPETKVAGIVTVPATSISTSYLCYGFGATVAVQCKLGKNMALQLGADAAYLWGNKVEVVTTVGSSSTTDSADYKATAFYFIPDLSLVYRF